MKDREYQVVPLGEQVKERISRIVVQQGRISSSAINSLVIPFFTNARMIDDSYIDKKILDLKKEGFIEEMDHGYRPTYTLIEKGIEHIRAMFYLAKIGINFGLDVWIGEKYHECNYKGSNFKELSTIHQKDIENILRNLELIQDVDVIWIDQNRPIYHFEVQEEYDKIPDEVVQLSNELSRLFSGVRRIIVGNNSLCDMVRNQENPWGYWDCLTFKNLEDYFNKDTIKQPVDSFDRENKIYQEEAEIIGKTVDYLEGDNDKRAKHCTLKLLSKDIIKSIRPGQFVAVSCSHSSKIKTKEVELKKMVNSPDLNITLYENLFLLRRPFSVHRIYYKDFRPKYLKRVSKIPGDFLALIKGGYKDSFAILFKIVGRGTEQLAKLKKGDKISILGPLGNGISDVPLNTRVAYLVAGGIGIAPLYAVAEHLRWLGIEVKLIAGGEENLPLERIFGDVTVKDGYSDNQVHSLAEEFREIGCEVDTVLASKGEGNAVEKFEQVIKKERQEKRLNKEITRIYACGHLSMLKAITEIASREQIECEVFLEKRMGCCIGTCLSCICDTYEKKNGHYNTNRIIHKRVCYDGPVFNSKEVKW